MSGNRKASVPRRGMTHVMDSLLLTYPLMLDRKCANIRVFFLKAIKAIQFNENKLFDESE